MRERHNDSDGARRLNDESGKSLEWMSFSSALLAPEKVRKHSFSKNIPGSSMSLVAICFAQRYAAELS